MSKPINVVCYGRVEAKATNLTVDLYVGNELRLELYPEESRKLRKALKKAERATQELSGR